MTVAPQPSLLMDTVLPSAVLADLVRRIEVCHDELYRTHEGEDTDRIVARYFTREEIEFLQKAVMGNQKREAWSAALNRLKQEVLAWPTVEVELAWKPEESFVSFLTDWFGRQGMAPARLVLQFHPEILGGLVVGYEGKRYDLSLMTVLQGIHEQLPTIGN